MNIQPATAARQPPREPWPLERLIHMRAVALGMALAPSTQITYSSALHSWLNFCKIHGFAVEPTADTFSFFIVFMAHHIKPDSVASYLSGICSQLEPYFPDVRQTAGHPIVRKTLAGMRRLRGTEVRRRQPASIDDIRQIATALRASTAHDDRLFLAMVLTAFFALMRCGELTWPDKIALQSERKLSPRHSVRISDTAYEFLLPGHKGDRFFEGSRIVVQKLDAVEDPWAPFTAYLQSRDALFKYRPELWLRNDGTIPKYSWFTTRLKQYFADSDRNIGGQSLRAGGATRLAELGASSDIIQAAGRWSSEAFRIYIRKNPVVPQAMIFGRPAFQEPHDSAVGSGSS